MVAAGVLLLPKNPDRSAETLRRGLGAATATDVAVIINDSFGRPLRRGTASVAMGVAGLPALCARRRGLVGLSIATWRFMSSAQFGCGGARVSLPSPPTSVGYLYSQLFLQ